jgi:DNA-binding NarL/FixJ family response regulator
MPGIDGYETCRRLKKEERWRDTPVLFLTALNETTDKVRGFEVGAVDFITKPLHPEEVLARVRAHLQIRSLQQDLKEKNALLEKAVALRIEAEKQLQQSLDRAVLVVFDRDQIQFCTRLARRLLDRYFPSSAKANLLPPALVEWSVNGHGKEPWQKELGETRLQVRMFAEARPGGCFMLLLEERAIGGESPESLLSLGLTSREAEVLFWIAHGKTSPEIAIILEAAPNTVKKHVQNILLKLGVETRLAAALRATEVLGLAGVDPAKFHAD